MDNNNNGASHLAPCFGLILKIGEVEKKYSKYYSTMKTLALEDQNRFRGIQIRNFVRSWPRSSSSMFKEELKIKVANNLEPLNNRLHEIHITSAMGPNSFTFQLKSMLEKLKDLEAQMKIYYDDPESNYRDPNYVIATGVFLGSYYACFSRKFRRWVRCRCASDCLVIDQHSVATVLLIDYGPNVTEVVKANSLRPLIPSFCSNDLPAFGYHGSLLHTPEEMSQEICCEFRSNTVGKSYYCYPYYYQMEELRPSLSPHAIVILMTNKNGKRLIVGERGECMEDLEDKFSENFEIQNFA